MRPSFPKADKAAKAVTEPAEDSETRERRELRSEGERVRSPGLPLLTGRRGVTGASCRILPMQSGLSGAHAASSSWTGNAEPEVRAVTPGPAADETVSDRPGRLCRLRSHGRTRPRSVSLCRLVASGEAHFPALERRPHRLRPKAEGRGRRSQTAAAFESDEARRPGRITGQFVIRVEDLALMPSMESGL